MKKIKLDSGIEDWPFYNMVSQSVSVIQEPRVYVSELLGPDGEPLIYVQEYKPGFKLHE